jgi:hypothetical protein
VLLRLPKQDKGEIVAAAVLYLTVTGLLAKCMLIVTSKMSTLMVRDF